MAARELPLDYFIGNGSSLRVREHNDSVASRHKPLQILLYASGNGGARDRTSNEQETIAEGCRNLSLYPTCKISRKTGNDGQKGNESNHELNHDRNDRCKRQLDVNTDCLSR